jgi:hypothetical protein
MNLFNFKDIRDRDGDLVVRETAIRGGLVYLDIVALIPRFEDYFLQLLDPHSSTG